MNEGIEFSGHSKLKMLVEKEFFSNPENIAWLYNYLIEEGVSNPTNDIDNFVKLSRPVGAVQGADARKQMIENALSTYCINKSNSAIDEKVDGFIRLSKQMKSECLVPSDTSFLNSLKDEEILLCWAYVRDRYTNSYIEGLYSDRAITMYIQSDIRFPEQEVREVCNNYYIALDLPVHINSISDAKESLIDFIFNFGSKAEHQRILISILNKIVIEAQKNNFFNFAKDLPERELGIIWDKLRNEHHILSAGCSTLKEFGFPRIYAAFNLWDIPVIRKKSIVKKLEEAIKRRLARKNPNNKEKINLTLTAEAKEKLTKAAGGQRQISAFVENWIRSL